jgi:hypothetical protein
LNTDHPRLTTAKLTMTINVKHSLEPGEIGAPTHMGEAADRSPSSNGIGVCLCR